MMNQNTNNNTQAQATITLTEAVVELTQLLKEAIALAKEEEAASTTETTTATTATTTEATTAATATTAPIVVLDDDDNVIATNEAGEKVIPPFATATTAEATTATTTDAEVTTETATATTEATVETTGKIPCPPETVTAVEDAAETKKINLDGLYKVLKYTIEKEGSMVRMDHSPYAPARNLVADVGNHTIYLSLTDEEVKVIIVKKDYFNPSMTISVNNNREYMDEVKTFKKDALNADSKTKKLIEIIRDIISLTM